MARVRPVPPLYRATVRIDRSHDVEAHDVVQRDNVQRAMQRANDATSERRKQEHDTLHTGSEWHHKASCDACADHIYERDTAMLAVAFTLYARSLMADTRPMIGDVPSDVLRRPRNVTRLVETSPTLAGDRNNGGTRKQGKARQRYNVDESTAYVVAATGSAATARMARQLPSESRDTRTLLALLTLYRQRRSTLNRKGR